VALAMVTGFAADTPIEVKSSLSPWDDPEFTLTKAAS
jgi:hypothetical protein